jgi:hypothetical protein
MPRARLLLAIIAVLLAIAWGRTIVGSAVLIQGSNFSYYYPWRAAPTC